MNDQTFIRFKSDSHVKRRREKTKLHIQCSSANETSKTEEVVGKPESKQIAIEPEAETKGLKEKEKQPQPAMN